MLHDSAPTLELEETLRRMGNDKELFRTLCEAFLEDAPMKIDAMRQEFAQNERQLAAQTAHSLRGAATTVGAVRIGMLSRALEQEMADIDDTKFMQQLESIRAELHALRQQLEQI